MGKQHTVGGLEALPVGREALCLQGDLPRLDECRSHYCKDTIEPGVIYDYQFSMVPMDHTVRAGRRLCLVLYGTDVEATQRPFAVTELSVEQDSVRVAVPMAPVHTLRSNKGNQ